MERGNCVSKGNLIRTINKENNQKYSDSSPSSRSLKCYYALMVEARKLIPSQNATLNRFIPNPKPFLLCINGSKVTACKVAGWRKKDNFEKLWS